MELQTSIDLLCHLDTNQRQFSLKLSVCQVRALLSLIAHPGQGSMAFRNHDFLVEWEGKSSPHLVLRTTSSNYGEVTSVSLSLNKESFCLYSNSLETTHMPLTVSSCDQCSSQLVQINQRILGGCHFCHAIHLKDSEPFEQLVDNVA